MKKIILLLAVMYVVFLSSCDNEPKEEPKPFPVGEWRTNYEYFSLAVADDVYPEFLKEMREKEESGAVTETKSYRLTFNENGTGSGSGLYPDGSGRYNFSFTWQLSDDRNAITVTKSGNAGVLYFTEIAWDLTNPGKYATGEFDLEEKMDAWSEIYWKIEESSSDNMELTTFFRKVTSFMDVYIQLDETHTYRYTFEKVE